MRAGGGGRGGGVRDGGVGSRRCGGRLEGGNKTRSRICSKKNNSRFRKKLIFGLLFATRGARGIGSELFLMLFRWVASMCSSVPHRRGANTKTSLIS